MSHNLPQYLRPNGSTPLAEGERVSLQLQLAQAQRMIQSLQTDNKKLGDELQDSKEKAVRVMEGVASYTNSLKRKHQGEVQGLNHDINTLTNFVRQTRGLPLFFADQGADSDHVDLSHGTTSDIYTRSRKKARLNAPRASLKTLLVATPFTNASSSSNGATAAPVPPSPVTSGTGSRIFIPGIPAMPQAGDFGPHKTFSAGEGSSSDTTDFLHPARPREIFPVCIFCYTNHLRCDDGEPCVECAERGRKCKRAKCVNFEGGSCRNPKCLRAHEEDSDYANVCDAGHVRQKDRKGGNKRDGKGGRRTIAS